LTYFKADRILQGSVATPVKCDMIA